MRLWAWLRARLGSYFWLPCPVCGRMFGGHEVNDDHGILIIKGRNHQVTCPRCPHTYVVMNNRIMRADVRFDDDDKPFPIFISTGRLNIYERRP